VTNDENNINVQYLKQIDIKDINLSSFLSTINFYDHLCNICDIVSFIVNDQAKALLNEIKNVNKILPANVYVPFVKDSIRNYVVAHLPLSEIKIIKTKNRCPYMLTIETFRAAELAQ
jgi:phosphatidylinositol 4-kinase